MLGASGEVEAPFFCFLVAKLNLTNLFLFPATEPCIKMKGFLTNP